MMFKRCISIAICLVLSIGIIPVCTMAAESTISPNEPVFSDTFIPMSKAEYEHYVDVLKNGSTKEKEAAVNAIFEHKNDAVGTNSWSASYSQDMGDGTYLVQGFVKCSHTKNGMTVRTTVPASMRGNGSFGYTWTEAGEGYSTAASGIYTYSGNITTKLLSPSTL